MSREQWCRQHGTHGAGTCPADTPAPAVGRVEDEGLRALSAAAAPGTWTVLIADGDTVICRQQGLGLITGPVHEADAAFIVAAVNYVRDRLSAAPAPVGDEAAVRAALEVDIFAESNPIGWGGPMVVSFARSVAALSAPGERDNARPTTGERIEFSVQDVLEPEDDPAPALGFCPRCGQVVGLMHTRPECDAYYTARYEAARAATPAARQERDGLRARVAQLFDVHRLTIGDGDDMSPDTCTCGRWEATTLDTAEADRQWQRHLADEVLAALDADDEQGRPA